MGDFFNNNFNQAPYLSVLEPFNNIQVGLNSLTTLIKFNKILG